MKLQCVRCVCVCSTFSSYPSWRSVLSGLSFISVEEHYLYANDLSWPYNGLPSVITPAKRPSACFESIWWSQRKITHFSLRNRLSGDASLKQHWVSVIGLVKSVRLSYSDCTVIKGCFRHKTKLLKGFFGWLPEHWYLVASVFWVKLLHCFLFYFIVWLFWASCLPKSTNIDSKYSDIQKPGFFKKERFKTDNKLRSFYNLLNIY